jgi:hypothetical protein
MKTGLLWRKSDRFVSLSAERRSPTLSVERNGLLVCLPFEDRARISLRDDEVIELISKELVKIGAAIDALPLCAPKFARGVVQQNRVDSWVCFSLGGKEPAPSESHESDAFFQLTATGEERSSLFDKCIGIQGDQLGLIPVNAALVCSI